MLADLTMIATQPVDEWQHVQKREEEEGEVRAQQPEHLTRFRACRSPSNRSCRPTIRIAQDVDREPSIDPPPTEPPVQAPSEKPGITEPPRPRA